MSDHVCEPCMLKFGCLMKWEGPAGKVGTQKRQPRGPEETREASLSVNLEAYCVVDTPLENPNVLGKSMVSFHPTTSHKKKKKHVETCVNVHCHLILLHDASDESLASWPT